MGVLFARDAVNKRFYGIEHDARDILMGPVPAPSAAQPLYDALATVTGRGTVGGERRRVHNEELNDR